MKSINISILENQLKQIESSIPDFEKTNPAISKVNVAWQLDHSLKVINSVVKVMKSSDAKGYVDNFKFLGKLLLKLNYFPRGKAKAPKHVIASKVILKEDLITQLALAKESIKEIKGLHENAHFKHPLFGNVNKQRILPFLKAHTNHHLKIVKTILK